MMVSCGDKASADYTSTDYEGGREFIVGHDSSVNQDEFKSFFEEDEYERIIRDIRQFDSVLDTNRFIGPVIREGGSD